MNFKRQIVCILSLVVIGVAFLRGNSLAKELSKSAPAYNLVGTWDVVARVICSDDNLPETENFVMVITDQWGNVFYGYFEFPEEPTPEYFNGAILGTRIMITSQDQDQDGVSLTEGEVKREGTMIIGLGSDYHQEQEPKFYCTGSFVAVRQNQD